MSELLALKVTSCVAISGKIKKAGSIVYADEALAKQLLNRGKVKVATPEEAMEAEPEAPTAIAEEQAPAESVAQAADEAPAEPEAPRGKKK